MICSDRAWNNFVMLSEPGDLDWGTPRRAAAIAILFNNITANGGLYHFLGISHDLASDEVVTSLGALGAGKAQWQLEYVLQRMGCTLPVMDAKEREALVDACWPDFDDDDAARAGAAAEDELLAATLQDCVSAEAEAEPMQALERHVAEHEEFYAGLGDGSPWPPPYRAG